MRTKYSTLALMAMASVLSAAAQAGTQVEPQPQDRSIYVRGLVGIAIHERHTPVGETEALFDYGGELGVRIFTVPRLKEFNAVLLGVHFETYTFAAIDAHDVQTTILGQLLFQKSEDFGAYFGPEFGIRKLDVGGGTALENGLVGGIVGGIEIPISDVLTYGPQFELTYAAPIHTVNALNQAVIDSALVSKIFLAISAHF